MTFIRDQRFKSVALLGLFGIVSACSAPAGSGGDESGDGDSSPSGGSSSAGTGGQIDGGSSGGAGSGGAASSTGGMSGSGDGGAPAAGVLFSSDFESDQLGAVSADGSTWTTTLPTQYDSGGLVQVVDDVPAHSGSKSVYVKKGNDGQAFLQLVDPAVFPFSGSTIHVRAYIRVPEWPSNHASWMEVGKPTNEEHELRVGAHQSVLQVNHWPGDQDQIAEGVTMMPNTWHCIEYRYDASTETLQVWLDDAAIDALTVIGSFARGGAPAGGFPPIEAVRFGAEIAATEVWFDDIAVGTGPIGCAAPAGE